MARQRYTAGFSTGAIAAALAADSVVFAMRLDPNAGRNALIQMIRLVWAVSTAFTTATVAGRRLALKRGAGAAAGGGTVIATAAKHDPGLGASQFDSGEGGDMRVATTGSLTQAGITYEAGELLTFGVAGLGAINSSKVEEFDLRDDPIVVRPGELLAIRNPAAMDAAGVWNLAGQIAWSEHVSDYGG
jgi:hypothetical protein